MNGQANRARTDLRTAIHEPMPSLPGESRKLRHAPRIKSFGKRLSAQILRACVGSSRHIHGGRRILPHFGTWLQGDIETPLHIDALAQPTQKAKRRPMLRAPERAIQSILTSHLAAAIFIIMCSLYVRASVRTDTCAVETPCRRANKLAISTHMPNERSPNKPPRARSHHRP